MAEGKVINNYYNITVTDKGTLAKTAKGVEGLKNSLNNVEKMANDGSKGLERMGATGTVTGRNLSRVASSIDVGIAPAYAKFAANIIAVSIAFEELRRAAQVQQVVAGIEYLGARAGISLSTTAESLRDLTGAAISTESALRATAQLAASGFDVSVIERVGKAAADTSVALGRNLNDSIERLSKGITKLEPELLDELGIMVKLDEATQVYALANNKTALSLSSMEKRVAYANAALAEAEAKFGGVSAAAGDTLAYERLASALQDLRVNSLEGLSVALTPLVALLNSSPIALISTVGLFGNTLAKSAIPGIYNMSEAAKEAADDLAKLKAAELSDVKTTKIGGNSKITSEYNKAIKENLTENHNVVNAINASDAAQKAYNDRLNDGTKLTERQRAAYLKNIEALKLQRKELSELETVTYRSTSAARESLALEAMQAGNYTKYTSEKKAALSEFDSLQRKNYATSALNGVISEAAYVRTATGIKSATIAAKAYGTALLTALPYIAAIGIAAGIAFETYKWATYSEDAEKYKQSMKGLKEATESLTAANESYGKIANSTASYQSRLTSEYEIAGNVINTLSMATKELIERKKQLDAQGGLPDWLYDLINGSGSASVAGKLLSEGDIESFKRLEEEIKGASMALHSNTLEAQFSNFIWRQLDDRYKNNAQQLKQIREAYASTNPMIRESAKRAVEYAGGLDAISSSSQNAQAFSDAFSKALMRMGNLGLQETAEEVKAMQQSLKELDKETTTFLRGAIESTRYDGVVKQLGEVSDRLREIQNLSARFGNDDDAAKTLVGLGENTIKLLTAENQERVRSVQLISAEIQALKARKEELGGLSQTDQNLLSIKESQLKNSEMSLEYVRQNVLAVEEQFAQAQNLERITKSQVGLEQARLNRFADLYSMTGAGEKRRIDAENRIRGLQSAQLSAQAAIIRASIEKNKLVIEELKNTLKVTDELRVQTLLIEQRAARMKYDATLVKANGNEASKAVVAAKAELDSKIKTAEELEKHNKLEKENRDLTAAALALEKQAAAINMGNISLSEKNLRAKIIDLKNEQDIQSAVASTAKARADILVTEKRLQGLRTDNSDSFAVELALFEAQNVELESKVKSSAKALEIAKTEAALVLATAKIDGTSAGEEAVRISLEKLKATEDSHSVLLATVSAEKELNKEELLGVRYATDYLDKKQEVLSLASRELDAMRDMVDSRAQLATLEAKIKAARQGRELTESEERQLNIANLEDRIRLAKVEAGIREATIDAEYALLAFQAQQATINLKAQQEAVIDKTGRADPYLTQLISSFDSLPASLAKAQQAQKEVLAQATLGIEKELELAKIQGQNRTAAYNPFISSSAKANKPQAADVSLKGISKEDLKTLPEGLNATESAAESVTEVVVRGLRRAKEEVISFAAKVASIEGDISDSVGFYANEFSKLGPQGEAMSSALLGLSSFSSAISTIGLSFDDMTQSVQKATKDLQQNTDTTRTAALEYEVYKAKMEGVGSILSGVGSAVAAISQIQQASSQASQNAIDQQINAEKARDGQSTASLAKIKALEDKKDQMARKSFETNKKLQMAQAVVNTAAAVSFGLANPFPLNLVLAGIAGAMGAAQLALISSTSYQSASGSSNTSTSEAASLAIGSRTSSVDVAKGNTNAGNEIAYLRGAQGTGNGPSDFKATPRAYGGSAYLVGEKGPEVIYPTQPSMVVPNNSNDNFGSAPINVSLNVSAMDAKGVDEVLTKHSGTIIEGIRGVANNSGISFLENVNTNINKARKM